MCRKAGLLGAEEPAAGVYTIWTYSSGSGVEEIWGTAQAGILVEMDYSNNYGEMFIKAVPYYYNSGVEFESYEPSFIMPACDIFVTYGY